MIRMENVNSLKESAKAEYLEMHPNTWPKILAAIATAISEIIQYFVASRKTC